MGGSIDMRSIVTIALGVLLAGGAASAARGVTVSIVPADTTVTVGDTLSLRVVCTDFPDLKGFELVHAFDPVRLASLAVQPGDLLTGIGRAYVAYSLPDVSVPADSTWLDAAVLDGSTAGPGVLEYLVFKALGVGSASIECLDVLFRDSSNASTVPACTGAMVRITTATPVRRASWGSLKSVYR